MCADAPLLASAERNFLEESTSSFSTTSSEMMTYVDNNKTLRETVVLEGPIIHPNQLHFSDSDTTTDITVPHVSVDNLAPNPHESMIKTLSELEFLEADSNVLTDTSVIPTVGMTK